MKYKLSNSELSFTVDSFGAELKSLYASDGTSYLWEGNAEYWTGSSPVLFPYVARLTGNHYYLDSKQYTMSIHGLAPYYDFSCLARNADSITLELAASPATMLQYPRLFSFRVTYALKGRSLTSTYTVENRDEKTMYFGLGGHPGFNVPVSPALSFDDYYLKFDSAADPERVGFSTSLFPDGTFIPYPLSESKKLPLKHALFDDDVVILRNCGNEVTLASDCDNRKLTMLFSGFPYLGLWHWPKTDAPYICLEPWLSLPSRNGIVESLETQPGLISLPAGKTYTAEWTVTVSDTLNG